MLTYRISRQSLGFVLGSAASFALRAAGAAFALLFSISVTRLQGANDAGLFFLALTIATVVSTLTRLGLNQSLVRFVAANASIQDWAGVKGVSVRGIYLTLASSIIATVAVIILARPLSLYLFNRAELVVPLRWISPSIIAVNLLMLYASLLKGRKRIAEALLVENIIWPLLATCVLLIPFGLAGATHAALAYSAGTALAAVVGFLAWRRAIPECSDVKGHFATRELLKSSMPLLFVDTVTLLMTWFPVLFLGLWSNDAEIAIYSTAARAAFTVSLVLHSVNVVAAPRFAELHRQNDYDGLRASAHSATNLSLLAALPILLIFLFMPGAIMSLFGAEFVAGAPILQILAIGQFLMVAAGPAIILLMMAGHERLSQYSYLVGGAFSLVLNIALIPRLGAAGAALATTISLGILNATAVALTWRQLHILTLAVAPFPRRFRPSH